jgi:hypothetical protein
MDVVQMRLAIAIGLVLAVLSGCSGPTPAPSPSIAVAPGLSTCRDAFVRWVGGAASLNSPGTDRIALLADQETVQRRVFELCGVAEAERLNLELKVEYAPGVRQPMIEPDMRTFADVECLDESPLLDGTRLCAEVGH